MERADPHVITERIRAARARQPLLLLCDFDGTLTEFHPDPAAVSLSSGRRDLLLRIAAQPGTTIGIVSGRRLDDVRERTRLSAGQGFTAGFHGLEIEGPGEGFVHPDIGAARSCAQKIADEIHPLVSPLPGVFIEDKVLSIVLHFRDAAPEHQRLASEILDRTVGAGLAACDVRVMRGACMLEVLPNIPWTKGNAVEWIREQVTRDGVSPFTVYIGDDVTDEDAFRAVRGYGLSIAASDRVSGADYIVDGPAAVEQILEEVAR